MKRFLITAVAALLLLCACGGGGVPSQYKETSRQADMFPDYRDVAVPPNIAPLNFIVRGSASAYAARVSAAGKNVDAAAGSDGKLQFNEEEWHALLSAAKGGYVSVSVFSKGDAGWEKHPDFRFYVAPEPIDSFVSYRLIEPGFEVYRQIGLYQRNLTNYDQRVIYENNRSYDSDNNHCVNCHNYQNYSTRNMLFHIRGSHGGTMIVRDGKPEKMNMKSDSILSSTVYPTWHPRKPWLVFSSNKTGQTFHMVDNEKIEVVDIGSDLVFYDADRKVLRNVLRTKTDFETFPCWAPDGKKLYYCVAHMPDFATLPDSMQAPYLTQHYREVRYNLMSLTFDERTQTFGQPQLELDCAAMRKSASVPRVSPDGRYLLFTLGDFGQFHIWHRSADLYIKDLTTGEVRPLSHASSKNTDSYHAWSSNGRWIVFSSRRDDGSFTRLYISYFDKQGRDHKAFLLPQRDPEQNVLLLKSYNVPEFSRDAVRVSADELRKLIYTTDGTPVGYEQKPNSKQLFYYKPNPMTGK